MVSGEKILKYVDEKCRGIGHKMKREFIANNAYDVGSCPRSIVYKKMNVTPTNPFSDKTLKIMGRGTVLHEFIVDRFKRAGLYLDDEVPVYDASLPFSGRIDLVFKWQGRTYLGEIKTKTSWAFKDWKNAYCEDCGEKCKYNRSQKMYQCADHPLATIRIEEEPSAASAPVKKDELQLQIYLNLTEFDKGFLIYYNMNTSDIYMHEINRSQEKWDAITKMFADTTEHAKNGTLPDRPYARGNWMCTGCLYRDRCWKVDK